MPSWVQQERSGKASCNTKSMTRTHDLCSLIYVCIFDLRLYFRTRAHNICALSFIFRFTGQNNAGNTSTPSNAFLGAAVAAAKQEAAQQQAQKAAQQAAAQQAVQHAHAAQGQNGISQQGSHKKMEGGQDNISNVQSGVAGGGMGSNSSTANLSNNSNHGADQLASLSALESIGNVLSSAEFRNVPFHINNMNSWQGWLDSVGKSGPGSIGNLAAQASAGDANQRPNTSVLSWDGAAQGMGSVDISGRACGFDSKNMGTYSAITSTLRQSHLPALQMRTPIGVPQASAAKSDQRFAEALEKWN